MGEGEPRAPPPGDWMRPPREIVKPGNVGQVLPKPVVPPVTGVRISIDHRRLEDVAAPRPGSAVYLPTIARWAETWHNTVTCYKTCPRVRNTPSRSRRRSSPRTYSTPPPTGKPCTGSIPFPTPLASGLRVPLYTSTLPELSALHAIDGRALNSCLRPASNLSSPGTSSAA